MKFKNISALLAIVGASAEAKLSSRHLKNKRVAICHLMKKTTTLSFKTLRVHRKAVKHHQSHGDWVDGGCNGNCGAVCAHAAGGVEPCHSVVFVEKQGKCHCPVDATTNQCGPNTECVATNDPNGVCTCLTGYRGDPESSQGCTRDACSNVAFVKHVIDSNCTGCYAADAIDFDQDGDTDVVASSALPDSSIAWYENIDGQGNFIKHIIETGVPSQSLFAVDLDKDGAIDVLAATWRDSRIVWYKNDGNQNFNKIIIDDGGADGASGVFAIDLDNDGDLDVLSASFNKNGSIAWYENDGNQNFVKHEIDNDIPNANSVFAADVDGDGHIDVLATGSITGTVGMLSLYKNNGISTPPTFTKSILDSETFRVVIAADLDGDGKVDLLSDNRQNGIVWHENLGNGTFSTRTVASASLGDSVVVADINRDGSLDVVSGAMFDGVRWHQNDGNEAFATHVIDDVCILNGCDSVDVLAADVNGDGYMDVIASLNKRDETAWYENVCLD